MLQKATKFFLYASLFSILVVLTGTFFPFIGGKYYFFRVAIEAAVAFAFLWWAFEAKKGEAEERVRSLARSPIVIAVSVFAFVYLLAAVFAYDPHAAFWSNFERGEGAFQMLHYYAFFLLLVAFFREEKDWRRLFGVSLIAAAGMILYGVFSAALWGNFVGPYIVAGKPTADTFFGRLFDPKQRFQGSLGNPAYVAPYILFSLFYALWLWFSKKWENKMLQNGFWVLVIANLLLFFTLSQTRGAFLGLGAAIIAYFLYLVFSSPTWRKKGLIGLVAVAVIGAGLFSQRNNPAVQNLPGGRFLSIDFGEATAQTRFWTWGSAWQGIKERPLFGWGPENFSVVFDKYFDPRHFVPNQQTETWFDRSHSIVFDYLAETGFLGFGALLAVLAVFYISFFRYIKRAEHKISGAVQALLFAIPIGYFVQGLVLFDVLPIYINLFAIFAFGAFLFSSTTTHHSHERRS